MRTSNKRPDSQKVVSNGKPEFVDTHNPNSYNSVGGPLAQLAEQLTLDQQVTGSIPVRLTTRIS